MKYKLDVNSILWKGGEVGEVVALWSCGGLFSVLLLDGAALGQHRPKHVVVSITVIKYTSVIKLCLTTYLLLVSHTQLG